MPQTTPQVAPQAKQETISRSIFMALHHSSTELAPAEVKLSKGGDKDQIAFFLLPHFPSFNANFYHCAYAVRSHREKCSILNFFCPLRISLETLLAQASQKVVTH